MKDTKRLLSQHLFLQHMLEQVKREVGNLVPHLPDEFGEVVVHRAEQLCPTEHKVQIASESRLASITGTTEATVVSWH